VLHAERLAHARELAREHWLRQALCELKSNGKPICTPTSKPTVRRSTHNEIEAFVRDSAATDSADDEIVIRTLDTAAGLRSALAEVLRR
jgi:hypothetical protein